MRQQPLVPQMGRKRRKILKIVSGVLSLLSIMIICYVVVTSHQTPDFEPNAKEGTPEPAESYMYSGLTSEYGYDIYLAGNLYRQEDGSLNIYFANSAENDVWLMVEVRTEKLNYTLYKSGIIKPGEYIENLPEYHWATNKARDVEIIVYAFEPETYISEGTTYMYATLQAW